MPDLGLFFVIVGGVVIASVVGLLLSRRYFAHWRTTADGGVAAPAAIAAQDRAAAAWRCRRSSLGAARRPRDRVALSLLLDLGLRRGELAGVRVSNFDLSRRALTVFGKGQKGRVLPLRGRVVLEIEAYLLTPLELLDRTPELDDFLLYPEKRSGGRRLIAAYPKRRQSEPARWYARLADAGLVADGVTSGLNMHRARHTFATELRRVAGIDAASQALGHADLITTLSIYGHHDQGDLERAMEALARARRS